MLTRLAATAAALMLVPILAACGSSSRPQGTSCAYPTDPASPARAVDPPPEVATLTGDVTATLDTTVGAMTATLDATPAPCTVGSFVSLAQQGFFDQTPCHRLTTAATGIFILQCGDPTGSGAGGPGYSVPDELSGKETYRPGTLAMANDNAPNTGGSQFFIVYQDTPFPRGYTVFGHLDPAGLKAVQKVAALGTDNAFGPGDGHPAVPVTLTKVTIG